jgi:hypothetical protein
MGHNAAEKLASESKHAALATFEVAIGTTTDKSRVWPVMAMTRMTQLRH